MTRPAGIVRDLWRYPVKSMLGERCEVLQVGERGVDGDRLFALRSADGKFTSGKNTRRFRKVDGLFRFQANYRDGIPCIRLPTGEVVGGNAPSVAHSVLSGALGQPVELVQEANISHLDAAPLHLVTTASLEWLRATLPAASIDARRFRPNLVIEVPGATLVEEGWLGKALRVGQEVVMEVTAATERCGMVAFAQSELPQEPDVLQSIAQQADLKFGVYARIVVSGVVRLGDPVNLLN